MNKEVSAGSGITTVAGRLALDVALLAFWPSRTAPIDGVSGVDAVSIAQRAAGVGRGGLPAGV